MPNQQGCGRRGQEKMNMGNTVKERFCPWFLKFKHIAKHLNSQGHCQKGLFCIGWNENSEFFMSFIWTSDFQRLECLKSIYLKENCYNLAKKRQSQETDICYAFTMWHFIAIISIEPPTTTSKVHIILTVHVRKLVLNNLPQDLTASRFNCAAICIPYLKAIA